MSTLIEASLACALLSKLICGSILRNDVDVRFSSGVRRSKHSGLAFCVSCFQAYI